MIIKEITDQNFAKQWNSFVIQNSSPASFLQSWQWGEFRQNKLNEKIFRLSIYENNELIGLCQFLKRRLPGGKFYLNCPRGPIIKILPHIKYGAKSETRNNNKIKKINFQNVVYNQLVNKIKEIAKQEKIVFVRIAPPYEKKYQLTPNYQLPKILTHLKEPENTLILDLQNSEKEILKNMHQKTRYNIRLAERKGIIVKIQDTRPVPGHAQEYNNQKITNNQYSTTEKSVNIFYELLIQTARRDKIKIFNKEYYRDLLNYFNQSPTCFGSTGSISSTESPRSEWSPRITNYQLQITLFIAEYNQIPLSAVIVLGFGDTVTYLHGASSNQYRNLMPNHLIQWAVIKWTKFKGYKFYDFWGIQPAHTDWSGITRFKQGFVSEKTRREINYIGSFDYVLDKCWYNLYRIGKILCQIKTLLQKKWH